MSGMFASESPTPVGDYRRCQQWFGLVIAPQQVVHRRRVFRRLQRIGVIVAEELTATPGEHATANSGSAFVVPPLAPEDARQRAPGSTKRVDVFLFPDSRFCPRKGRPDQRLAVGVARLLRGRPDPDRSSTTKCLRAPDRPVSLRRSSSALLLQPLRLRVQTQHSA